MAIQVGTEILAKLHHGTLFALIFPRDWFGSVLLPRVDEDADGRPVYRQYLAHLNEKLEKGKVEVFETDEQVLAKSAEYVAPLPLFTHCFADFLCQSGQRHRGPGKATHSKIQIPPLDSGSAIRFACFRHFYCFGSDLLFGCWFGYTILPFVIPYLPE